MYPYGSQSIGNTVQQVKNMLMTADLDTVLSTVANISDFSLSLRNITVGGITVKEVRLLNTPMIVIDLGDVRVGLIRVVKGVKLADVVKALSGYRAMYSSSARYHTCVSPPQYDYCTSISELPDGTTAVSTEYNFDTFVVKRDSKFSVDINTPDGYFHIEGISIYDRVGIYIYIFLSTVARFMPSVVRFARR